MEQASFEKDDATAALLFKAAGCPLPRLSWNPDPDDLPNHRLKFLHDSWVSLVEASGFPDPAWLAPERLLPCLGYLTVLEPVDSGRDFLHRLHGTKVARADGVDLTNTLVSELSAKGVQPQVQSLLAAVYRAVCQRRVPLHMQHVTSGPNTDAWDRLILPFWSAGGPVTRVLTCSLPDPGHATFGPLL